MARGNRVCAAILLGILSVPGAGLAQGRHKPRHARQSRTIGGVQGTPVKMSPALTDDAIALLALRTAVNPTETSKTEAAVKPGAPGSAEVPESSEKKHSEIGAMGQQVKEKQSKIELLMHMFVLDEQTFLRDPSGLHEDEETRAKRQFEQQELLGEARELARLQTRFSLLTAAGREKSAPAQGAAAN